VTGTNLAEILQARARDRGSVPGLHAEDGRSWTFQQVDLIAGGVAQALAAAGVGAGDRVGLYLVNGPEIVFFLFGAWKIGAVPVTISSLYNAEELAESIAKTDPKLLLADVRRAEVLQDLKAPGVTIRSVGPPGETGGPVAGHPPLEWGHQAHVEAVPVEPDAESCILFTGGTTGRPKAVSVTHGGTLDSLRRLAKVSTGTDEQGSASPDAKPNLIALPLFHSGGQHALMFAYFVGRGAVVWERFGVDRLAALMERFAFDNFFFLPTMIYDIVHAERDLPFTGVKHVLVAGQAISWKLRRDFELRYGVPILVNYGSTESGHIAGWTGKDMKAGLWKPGSAGRIYPGVELEIRDEDGRALPPGQQGEIVVRSRLTKGYVDDAEASAALVRDGWVHTGDIGYVDEDGVLWLVGRKRDMIKCGGFQVWPEEIEDVLREHQYVRDVRVLGRPDDRLGEIPVALVVRDTAAPLSDAELAEELIAFARDRLAHFKAPRRVEFVPELQRTASGKISRVAVPDSEGGPRR